MTTELQIIGFTTFENFVNLHKDLQLFHNYICRTGLLF